MALSDYLRRVLEGGQTDRIGKRDRKHRSIIVTERCFLRTVTAISRAEAEAKFHQDYLQPVPDRMALWATVYKPEGRYIGYCGVYLHFDE